MAEPRELPAPSIVADLCAQEAWRQAANEDTRRVLELACDTIRAVMRRCVTLARRNETAEADDPDSSMMPASVEWEFDICEGDVTMYSRSPSPSMLRFSTASSGTATNAILDDLPKSFSLPSGELQSTDQPILPVRVIREAVVNAVMHRSYRIQGAPTQIIRYANRLEIRNPGHSLKSIDHLGQPGSDTRNPKIAAVLHEVNIAETKGSGIRVMRELMQESNLLPPTMESSRHPDQFVATFLFHHFLGPDDVAWLGNLTAEQLTDEESRVLVFVREVGAIDNATYREINKNGNPRCVGPSATPARPEAPREEGVGESHVLRARRGVCARPEDRGGRSGHQKSGGWGAKSGARRAKSGAWTGKSGARGAKSGACRGPRVASRRRGEPRRHRCSRIQGRDRHVPHALDPGCDVVSGGGRCR